MLCAHRRYGHAVREEQRNIPKGSIASGGPIMARIFLSHSWKDKPFAKSLASSLRSAGHFVWVDEAEIAVGDSLIEKISDGLQESDYVVAVISNNSVHSNWVRKELYIAMHREIVESKVHILPIILDQCELPYFLRDKLYANFSDTYNFERSLSLLLQAIAKYDKKGTRQESEMIRTADGKVESSNGIGRPDVGSMLLMKDTKDFRMTKSMKHCWNLAILYGVMGAFIITLLLAAKAIMPSAFPNMGSRILVAVMVGAFLACAMEILEGASALILIQNDKSFLYDVEQVKGNLFPLQKSWIALFRSGWRNPIRAIYLLTGALYYFAPALTALLLFLRLELSR
jgi:hypothetical protein